MDQVPKPDSSRRQGRRTLPWLSRQRPDSRPASHRRRASDKPTEEFPVPSIQKPRSSVEGFEGKSTKQGYTGSVDTLSYAVPSNIRELGGAQVLPQSETSFQSGHVGFRILSELGSDEEGYQTTEKSEETTPSGSQTSGIDDQTDNCSREENYDYQAITRQLEQPENDALDDAIQEAKDLALGVGTAESSNRSNANIYVIDIEGP